MIQEGIHCRDMSAEIAQLEVAPFEVTSFDVTSFEVMRLEIARPVKLVRAAGVTGPAERTRPVKSTGPGRRTAAWGGSKPPTNRHTSVEAECEECEMTSGYPDDAERS